MLSFGAPGIAQEAEEHVHASPGSEEGLGRAHMEISCSTAVSVQLRYLQTLTESSRKEHLGRFPAPVDIFSRIIKAFKCEASAPVLAKP
jgi:hypothetical protein